LPDRLSAHGVDFVLLHLPGKVDASAADHCSSTPAQVTCPGIFGPVET
jgi:hypothetical protein